MHDVEIGKAVLLYLVDVLTKGCQWLAYHKERASRVPIPKTLWAGSSGIIWIRLLESMVREQGGHVTGFDHCQGTNLTQRTLFPFVELQTVNRFVTFSNAHINNYKTAAPDLLIKGPMPEIVMPKTKVPLKWFPKSRATKVKSVLYISSYVPSSQFGSYALLPAVPAFDWQARMIAMLRKQDIKVGIKPHPLSEVRHPEYFEKIDGVKMLSGRSEDHMDNYDAIVLDFSFQTSFGQVLRFGNPVIFIDLGFAEYSADQRARLEQRCGIVEAWFDDENRVQIDEDKLIEAIAKAPECTDMSIMDDIDGTAIFETA